MNESLSRSVIRVSLTPMTYPSLPTVSPLSRPYSSIHYSLSTRMDYDEESLSLQSPSTRIRTRNRLPFSSADFASHPPTPREVVAEIDRRQGELFSILLSPIPGASTTSTTPSSSSLRTTGIWKRDEETSTTMEVAARDNVFVAVMRGILKEEQKEEKEGKRREWDRDHRQYTKCKFDELIIHNYSLPFFTVVSPR